MRRSTVLSLPPQLVFPGVCVFVGGGVSTEGLYSGDLVDKTFQSNFLTEMFQYIYMYVCVGERERECVCMCVRVCVCAYLHVSVYFHVCVFSCV